jgi:hypothetical protein
MTNNTSDGVIVMGVGDVGPIHEPMSTYTTLARPVLEQADIRVGQCERVYSERGELQVHSGGAHSRVPPHFASIFSDCGFDLVSVASNHAMDWGPIALQDTIELLQSRGIKTAGAGRNLAEARQPVIFDRKGVKTAFLAYCSVLNEGYAAGPNKPGVAPLRARTFYEPSEYQPGTPPHIISIPYEEDVAGMVEDIKAARQQTNAVVLIIHWGIHFIPKTIAEYQVSIAKAAFAAGADLIMGHHAHVPKAIGVYDGKVCFYSMSNFIMSAPEITPERRERMTQHYGVTLDPAYPRLPYGTDAKRSLIVRAEVGQEGLRRVSFLPTLIDTQLRPEPLQNGDERFSDAVAYMEWASEGYNHRFEVQGNEVVVAGS